MIVLSATTGNISITSIATGIGVPVGMMSATCSVAFSITTGIVKKLLKQQEKKKKEEKNKIKLLC